jgi:hypothetical protein
MVLTTAIMLITEIAMRKTLHEADITAHGLHLALEVSASIKAMVLGSRTLTKNDLANLELMFRRGLANTSSIARGQFPDADTISQLQ